MGLGLGFRGGVIVRIRATGVTFFYWSPYGRIVLNVVEYSTRGCIKN